MLVTIIMPATKKKPKYYKDHPNPRLRTPIGKTYVMEPPPAPEPEPAPAPKGEV